MKTGTKTKRLLIKRATTSYCFLLFISLVVTYPATAGALTNQLKDHASPYLALHGNDPVKWQDWGEDVITRARQENKLIFISSGYFSCHWCHVMQRESYSDQPIADLMHQIAIPVKIDRELQPALDAWLINFTERTTGQSGWPLNVFLTPDGYPLVGMTYLPKENFARVLVSLKQRWTEEEQSLRDSALAAFKSMKPTPTTHSGKHPDRTSSEQLVKYLVLHALQLGDSIQGGFGDQNKFPMSPQLLALMDAWQYTHDEKLGTFLQLTLDQMANLGLHDHIGGGFYRYVVDPGWDIPHFEKMLYDNAQLASVYLKAAMIFDSPRYRDVALKTLDFTIEVMKHANGAYAASLSAVDDKNVEGGYYLWHADELENLLSKDELAAVRIAWDASGPPHLEDGYHLKKIARLADVAKRLSVSEEVLQKTLQAATDKLKRARSKRKLPADHKVLAAWNGLLLTSLTEAARQTGQQKYKEAASKLYKFLVTKLWDGKQLHRFLHQDKPGGRVTLEDYAYVVNSIIDWAELSGDANGWHTAKLIALAGLARFHNNSGWQLSEQLLIPYNARELVLADNTMPSPSATLLGALLRISEHERDASRKEKLLGLLSPDYDQLASSPLWYATHILLLAQVTR